MYKVIKTSVAQADRRSPHEITVSTGSELKASPAKVEEAKQAILAEEQADKASPVKAEGSPAVEPEVAVSKSVEKDMRLAELERREIAIRQQTVEMQRLKAEAEAASKGRMTLEEWKQKFLSGGAEELGLGYNDIAEKYLSQPSTEAQAIAELKRELQSIKDQNKSYTEQLEQGQKQAYDNALKQLRSETGRIVGSKAQEFETIAAMGAEDKVVDLIKSTYERDGVLMSVEEAAQQVENSLLEQALKYAGLNKVKAKIQPTEQTAEDIGHQQQTQKTLTRSLSQASSPLTAAERRARAIAAFKGTLS